jgi:bacteriorhodopsin
VRENKIEMHGSISYLRVCGKRRMKLQWLSVHATVAVLVCFGVLCGNIQRKSASARRLEPELERASVEQSMMIEAGNVAVFVSAIFFFALGSMILGQYIQGDLYLLQRSTLQKRLEFSMFACLYICFFSCLFNLVQYGPQDDHVLNHAKAQEAVVLDLGRPIEWILTCPIMQLILAVLGGEQVPDFRRKTMPLSSAIVLLLGVFVSFSTSPLLKLSLYLASFVVFGFLIFQMHKCVVESSGGTETLFSGHSIMRRLTVLVALTWMPFPVWHVLSPEGFHVIENIGGMKVIVAFLNVFAKGVFVFYLSRVRADQISKDQVLLEAKIEAEAEAAFQTGEGPKGCVLQPALTVVVHDVLRGMGREAEFDAMKRQLECNAITSTNDMMVVTPEHCDSRSVPYTFLTACKVRIKTQRLKNEGYWFSKTFSNSYGDIWTKDEHEDSIRVVVPPPHLANDPRKLKEYQRRTGRMNEDRHSDPPTHPDRQPEAVIMPVWTSTTFDPSLERQDPADCGQISGREGCDLLEISPDDSISRNQSKDAASEFSLRASGPALIRDELRPSEMAAIVANMQQNLLDELHQVKNAQTAESSRIPYREQVHVGSSNLHEELSSALDVVMGAIDEHLPISHLELSHPPGGADDRETASSEQGSRSSRNCANLSAHESPETSPDGSFILNPCTDSVDASPVDELSLMTARTAGLPSPMA